MSELGHGHVYPRSDGLTARCGGPALCSNCAKDLAEKQRTDSDGMNTMFVKLLESEHKLKSQLATLREALEHICDGHKHNRVSAGLYRLASEALKKCFGEGEKNE